MFKSTPPSTDFFPRKKARVLPNDGMKTGDKEKKKRLIKIIESSDVGTSLQFSDYVILPSVQEH